MVSTVLKKISFIADLCNYEGREGSFSITVHVCHVRSASPIVLMYVLYVYSMQGFFLGNDWEGGGGGGANYEVL